MLALGVVPACKKLRLESTYKVFTCISKHVATKSAMALSLLTWLRGLPRHFRKVGHGVKLYVDNDGEKI